MKLIKTDNVFEMATRIKLRFDTPRGQLSTEQLWDVPLRSKNDFNLDTVARTANKSLKAIAEESFVSTKKSPEQERLEVAFEVIKYVIETKLQEEESAKGRADDKKEKERLLGILAKKEDEELGGLSTKELEKRIKSLDSKS